jgi:hypothetical protein
MCFALIFGQIGNIERVLGMENDMIFIDEDLGLSD